MGRGLCVCLGEEDDSVLVVAEESVDSGMEGLGIAVLCGASAGREIDHDDDLSFVGGFPGEFSGSEGEQDQTGEDESSGGRGRFCLSPAADRDDCGNEGQTGGEGRPLV